MKESLQVRGNKEDLLSLMKFLREEGIPFKKIEKEKESDRLYKKEESETYGFLREIPYLSILGEVVKIILIGLTNEALKTLAKWLKERRNKGLENPDLEIIVKGNILKLNKKNLKTLENILKETTENKKKRKKKRKRKQTKV